MGFFSNMKQSAVSLFDTGEINELEDEQVNQISEREQVADKPVRDSQQQSAYQSEATQARATQKSSIEAPIRRSSMTRETMGVAPKDNVIIDIKFPKKYEDATEIVDLLIANECVLVDFQHMLDAQARRCLDFIDGASRVLYGNLQKINSSMYLLTPSNVIVNAEDLTFVNHSNQDYNFDYDIKRR